MQPDTERARLNRFDLTRSVIELAGEEPALVAGIGNAGFDLFHAGHRPLNFYMLGSMGQAVPIGLGLALAQPDRPVIVMEGDGSVLLNLSSLVTAGARQPSNLTVIIWDNEMWQITGGQRLATSASCNLADVARACGFASVETPEDQDAFTTAVRFALDAPGPHAIVVKIDPSGARAPHHGDPIAIKLEFMSALGVEPD